MHSHNLHSCPQHPHNSLEATHLTNNCILSHHEHTPHRNKCKIKIKSRFPAVVADLCVNIFMAIPLSHDILTITIVITQLHVNTSPDNAHHHTPASLLRLPSTHTTVSYMHNNHLSHPSHTHCLPHQHNSWLTTASHMHTHKWRERRGRHHTAKSPHLPSHHHTTHSPHPTLPTVHTGMMSSGKKVKYLAAMLRGLSAIIWRLVHV